MGVTVKSMIPAARAAAPAAACTTLRLARESDGQFWGFTVDESLRVLVVQVVPKFLELLRAIRPNNKKRVL